MSPLSDQQQGVIGQYEFGKLIVLGSHGLLEVDEPMSDDERRDVEIHRKHRFRRSLAVQVKTTRVLMEEGRILVIRFDIAKSNLFADPGFWYFLAHLDLKAMGFSDPCFLVPSHKLHEMARYGETQDKVRITFEASIVVGSHDRWVPYRVHPTDVAARILEIVAALKAERRLLRLPAGLETVPGLLWVGSRRS